MFPRSFIVYAWGRIFHPTSKEELQAKVLGPLRAYSGVIRLA